MKTQENLNNLAAEAANKIAAQAHATEGDHGHISESAEAFLVNLEAAMYEHGFGEAEVDEMLVYVLHGIAGRMYDGDWRGW